MTSSAMKISKLYVYPVKSLRATEPSSAVLTKHGFQYDRRFMILKVQPDGSLKNMAVASFPEMVLFFTAMDPIEDDDDSKQALFTITFKPPQGTSRSLQVPLLPMVDDLEIVEINMHNSPTKAYKMGIHYNHWLSDCFGYDVVLAYLGENLRRVLMSTSGNQQTNGSWLSTVTSKLPSSISQLLQEEQERITFADCAPYLIVSDTSLKSVSERLPDDEQMDISKFRPNIIVTGADSQWEEDYWAELKIGDATIHLIHNCARCKSINIDYATGKPGTGESGAILKKLQSDRRVDPGAKYSPIFGRYSFLDSGSEGKTISVGDDVTVTKRNPERTKFDWTGLNTL